MRRTATAVPVLELGDLEFVAVEQLHAGDFCEGRTVTPFSAHRTVSRPHEPEISRETRYRDKRTMSQAVLSLSGANKYIAAASDGDHSEDEHVPEAEDSHDDHETQQEAED